MVLSPEAAMKGLVRLEQITVNDRLLLRELNTLIGQSGWAFEKEDLQLCESLPAVLWQPYGPLAVFHQDLDLSSCSNPHSSTLPRMKAAS